MAAEPDRTVWLPKDLPLAIFLSIATWGIGGLGWGLGMWITLGGWLIGWLIAGLSWGASCWLFLSIYLLIACRELSTTIQVADTAALPRRLAEAVKRFRYSVEQTSPSSFVCQRKRYFALMALLPAEYSKLHVALHDGDVHLTGPAVVVNKVRKKLLVS